MAHDDLTTTSGLVRRLAALGVAMSLTDEDALELTGSPPPGAVITALRANKTAVVVMLSLERRLVAGWAKCEAEPDPWKRSRLEDHWIALLHDYERACDVPLLEEAA